MKRQNLRSTLFTHGAMSAMIFAGIVSAWHFSNADKLHEKYNLESGAVFCSHQPDEQLLAVKKTANGDLQYGIESAGSGDSMFSAYSIAKADAGKKGSWTDPAEADKCVTVITEDKDGFKVNFPSPAACMSAGIAGHGYSYSPLTFPKKDFKRPVTIEFTNPDTFQSATCESAGKVYPPPKP